VVPAVQFSMLSLHDLGLGTVSAFLKGGRTSTSSHEGPLTFEVCCFCCTSFWLRLKASLDLLYHHQQWTVMHSVAVTRPDSVHYCVQVEQEDPIPSVVEAVAHESGYDRRVVATENCFSSYSAQNGLCKCQKRAPKVQEPKTGIN
jgi:hypothetical protein